jgi:hypothetical protein
MKIYTSYFGKIKKLKENCIVPIGIARFPPKYVSIRSIFDLSPRPDMLRMSEEKYDREFMKILSKLNPNEMLRRMEEISGGWDCALLCFEKSGDPCHRYMVAQWLNRELGLDVTEYDYQPPKQPEAVQGSLF